MMFSMYYYGYGCFCIVIQYGGFLDQNIVETF